MHDLSKRNDVLHTRGTESIYKIASIGLISAFIYYSALYSHHWVYWKIILLLWFNTQFHSILYIPVSNVSDLPVYADKTCINLHWAVFSESGWPICRKYRKCFVRRYAQSHRFAKHNIYNVNNMTIPRSNTKAIMLEVVPQMC